MIVQIKGDRYYSEDEILSAGIKGGVCCQKCGSFNVSTLRSNLHVKRKTKIRERKCNDCKERWYTIEIVAPESAQMISDESKARIKEINKSLMKSRALERKVKLLSEGKCIKCKQDNSEPQFSLCPACREKSRYTNKKRMMESLL